MKIGIDAKWYFEGPVSNKVVIRNLVTAMAANPQGHQLYFFLNRRHRNRPFPFKGKHIHTVYVWAGNNMLSNLFLLPLLGIRLGLNGILYQNFGSFFGPPRWLYIHDVIFLQYPEFFSLTERLYFSFIPFLARFAAIIITISRHEKERLERFGFARYADIHFVHHGREKAFRPAGLQDAELLRAVRKKYGLPEKYLLYTGRINTRKNLLILLQAFQKTDTRMPMVFVGKKDWKNEAGLEQIMGQLEQSDRLILCGSVPFEDLPSILCQAAVFCFISRAEGFGLPVLEAMASGVPILTSENSAMAEICGTAALLTNPQDEKAVRQALQRLLHDQNLQNTLAEAGLKRSEDFSWEKTASELMNLISIPSGEAGK